MIALTASAFYASSILAFIGLGLTFWGALLLYITPTKYVKLELLNAVAHVKGMEFKRPKCGLTYNRDLNACINIAHALKRGMGWWRSEPPKPADEEIGVKPTLNAGSYAFFA